MKKQIPTNGRHTAKGYRGVQVRKDLRLAIYLRDGFHCIYCGKDLPGFVEFLKTSTCFSTSAGFNKIETDLFDTCRIVDFYGFF